MDVAKPATAAKPITVIIPTLNEAANIEPLLERVFAQRSATFDPEVLFVDDGSSDETCANIARYATFAPVRLIQRQNPRSGLAGAVLAGAEAATTRWVVVMDADLSHPPERIRDLVQPLLDRECDMIIGSRYCPGGKTPGWPWWRRLGSRGACLLAKPLTTIKDPLSGFFATERASLRRCKADAAGFKIALEVIAAAGNGFRVKELPIAFSDRKHGQSKMQVHVLMIYLERLARLLFQRLSAGLRGRFRAAAGLDHVTARTADSHSR